MMATLPPLALPVGQMTKTDLVTFIPQMLRSAMGCNRIVYGNKDECPIWWPKEVPFSNPRFDKRGGKQKLEWEEALRRVIYSCYAYHGLECMLAGELHQGSPATSGDEPPQMTYHMHSLMFYEDDPELSLSCSSPPQLSPAHSTQDLCPSPALAATVHTSGLPQANSPTEQGKTGSEEKLFTEVWSCFFCQEEFRCRSGVRQHQQQCAVRLSPPDTPHTPMRLDLRDSKEKDPFLEALQLWPRSKLHSLRQRKRRDLDCEIIDLNKDPMPKTPNTPRSQKSLMSQLSRDLSPGVAQRHLFVEDRHCSVDHHSSTDDEPAQDGDEEEEEEAVKLSKASSLLYIDLTSLLGQRIKTHVRPEFKASIDSDDEEEDMSYESYCHTPNKGAAHGRLRSRPNPFPVTYKAKRTWGPYCHKYKFNKRHKEEFRLTLAAGLDRRSRRLKATMRSCRLVLRNLSAADISRLSRCASSCARTGSTSITAVSAANIRWLPQISGSTWPGQPGYPLLTQQLQACLLSPGLLQPVVSLRHPLTVNGLNPHALLPAVKGSYPGLLAALSTRPGTTQTASAGPAAAKPGTPTSPVWPTVKQTGKSNAIMKAIKNMTSGTKESGKPSAVVKNNKQGISSKDMAKQSLVKKYKDTLAKKTIGKGKPGLNIEKSQSKSSDKMANGKLVKDKLHSKDVDNKKGGSKKVDKETVNKEKAKKEKEKSDKGKVAKASVSNSKPAKSDKMVVTEKAALKAAKGNGSKKNTLSSNTKKSIKVKQSSLKQNSEQRKSSFKKSVKEKMDKSKINREKYKKKIVLSKKIKLTNIKKLKVMKSTKKHSSSSAKKTICDSRKQSGSKQSTSKKQTKTSDKKTLTSKHGDRKTGSDINGNIKLASKESKKSVSEAKKSSEVTKTAADKTKVLSVGKKATGGTSLSGVKKAYVDTKVSSTGKKSTENTKVSSVSKKSVEDAKVSSTSKKSTENTKVSSVSKKSVEDAKVLSTSKKSTENTKVPSGGKKPTEDAKVSSTGKKSIENTKVPSVSKKSVEDAKVSSMNKKSTENTKVPSGGKKSTDDVKVSSTGKKPTDDAKVSSTGKKSTENTKVSSVSKKSVEDAKVSSTIKKSIENTKVPSGGKKSVEDAKVSSVSKKPTEDAMVLSTGKKSTENTKVSSTIKKSVEDAKVSSTSKKSIENTKVSSGGKKSTDDVKVLSTGKKPTEDAKVLSMDKKPIEDAKVLSTGKKCIENTKVPSGGKKSTADAQLPSVGNKVPTGAKKGAVETVQGRTSREQSPSSRLIGGKKCPVERAEGRKSREQSPSVHSVSREAPSKPAERKRRRASVDSIHSLSSGESWTRDSDIISISSSEECEERSRPYRKRRRKDCGSCCQDTRACDKSQAVLFKCHLCYAEIMFDLTTTNFIRTHFADKHNVPNIQILEHRDHNHQLVLSIVEGTDEPSKQAAEKTQHHSARKCDDESSTASDVICIDDL